MKVNKGVLKEFLRRQPILKKAATFSLRPLRRKQERKRTAKYHVWISQHDPTGQELANQKTSEANLGYRPLISIITPTYNTPEIFFRKMIESVLAQTYTNWELVIVDDASPDNGVRELIVHYAELDSRIKYLFLKKNHHIAGATNEAIELSSGEFVSLFDHDDVLYPSALFEIVMALNAQKNLDFIYTDEDKITEIKGNDVRSEPFFKPDWNPDFLRSVNYITHFTTIRRSVLDRLGYEDKEYNGAQDWELFLRVTRGIPEKNIHHIPKILYGWRIHDASTAKDFSTKPYVVESQRKAIEADLRAKGYKHAIVAQDRMYPGQWQLTFTPSSADAKISIIVIGQDKGHIAQDIKANTTYRNYEIVFVRALDSLEKIIEGITGDYLVLLDGRACIAHSDWLQAMFSDAERKDTGFVVKAYAADASAMENARALIGQEAADFVRELGPKALSGHLYATTRYNISDFKKADAAMVEVRKLREVARGGSPGLDLAQISRNMGPKGYRNLYNPYIK